MAQDRKVIIDTESLTAGDILIWDGTDFSTVSPATEPGSIPAALTGGESPTEAEHNALITYVVALKDALITGGALLEA